MSFSERLPLWWDRETDEQTGGPLRPDVREAAHRVWKWLCFKSRELLGDSADAAEILEASVKAISRYLNKRSIGLHAADPAGLLHLACYRSLRRLARKRRRIETAGQTSELAEILRAPDWRREIDRSLFLQELARELNSQTRGVLRLRMAGYNWTEIGRMLHMNAGNLRTSFWRDIRRAHLRLLQAEKGGTKRER